MVWTIACVGLPNKGALFLQVNDVYNLLVKITSYKDQCNVFIKLLVSYNRRWDGCEWKFGIQLVNVN